MVTFQPELIIFDLDGTLVEFPHSYLFEETNRILRSLQWPQVDADTLHTFFSAFDYFGFVEEERRQFFIDRFWRDFDHGRYPGPVPFLGTLECLRSLAQTGIRLAIATARTATEEDLRRELAHTGVMDYVSALVTRNNRDGDWTDKTGLIADLCGHFRIDPRNAAMVGDIPPDITSAQEAGIGFTVAVLSGGIRADVLQTASPNLVLSGIAVLNDHLLAA